MFKIAKEFNFDMAHMLDGHDGKCKNLHGHTYKLQVECSRRVSRRWGKTWDGDGLCLAESYRKNTYFRPDGSRVYLRF